MSAGIVMLVNEFPPLPVGGAEKQAERLSKYLSLRGWHVWVITRHQKGLPYEERENGFRIIRPATIGPGKLKTITFVLGIFWRLWRLKDKYEILHAHLAVGPAFAGVVAARLLGKNSIVKFGNTSGEFGGILNAKRTLRGRLRLHFIRRWADVVIVLDDAMRQEVISAGFDANRVRLMSNGIDAVALHTDDFEFEAGSGIGSEDRVIAIFVGRLTKQKSLTTLLQALAIASRSCSSLHLTLLGEGPERTALEQQALALGITKQITFAGYDPNVESYLRSAHIFVLPSVAEGISNALLEAMSLGLPCLASSVGGNVEVLDHGKYGVLLPPDDVNAWAQALETMAAAESLRLELGELARRRIVEKYDFGIIGMKYEELYEELLVEGRKN
jgi:glycosyltransferase involved in cell wall biosynthesis